MVFKDIDENVFILNKHFWFYGYFRFNKGTKDKKE